MSRLVGNQVAFELIGLWVLEFALSFWARA